MIPNPPFYNVIDKILYAIVKSLEGDPIMTLPKPPFHNATSELLYAIHTLLNGTSSGGSSSGSGTVSRKASFTVTGDGVRKSFTVAHNLNSADIAVQVRDMQDGLKQVFLDNYPDPADQANKLIIQFDYAPLATKSFKVIVIS